MLAEDIYKLRDYLDAHAHRLDLDVANARLKNDIPDENFYKGSKSATTLIRALIDDVITRHERDFFKDKCPNCDCEDEQFHGKDCEFGAIFFECEKCGSYTHVFLDNTFEVIKKEK